MTPRRAVCLLLGLACMTVARAELVTGTEPDSGLAFWRYLDDGISLELVQRLPDQTRAFFLARGFHKAGVEAIATDCVFQSALRNTASSGALSYDLSEWAVIVDGKAQAMKLRDEWDRQWQSAGVPQAARIAFRWSLLPSRQRYQPGDYNWGMTTFRLAPGVQFDLEIRWRRDGVAKTARIPGIRCAPDLPTPAPAQP